MRTNSSHFPGSGFKRRGVVLIEALLVVALVIVTCSLAYQQLSGVRRGSENASRAETVKMLNSALGSYLENGGAILAGTSADTLLGKMKKKAAEAIPGTFAGLRGPFVDVRLKPVPADLQSVSPRIVWDAAKRRFGLALEGAGWSSLAFDDQEGLADHGTDARVIHHNFAREDQWVWDYKDPAMGRKAPVRVATSDPGVGQLPLVDDTIPLLPPVINPFTGTFDHHAFPLALTITNPNAPGTSEVLYKVNGGSWLPWMGGQSSLPKSLTTTVSAFAQAHEMSAYTDSGVVTETYVTYFMRGLASGIFRNPAGDKQFLYNLNAGGANFSWGKVESAGQSVSSLEMVPGSMFEAGDGETFTIGTLHYTNGTTRAGTNATSATLRVDLALSIPSAGTVSVDIPVRMLNTIHYSWTPESDRVDYLWVPQCVTLSQPVTILDRHFTLSIQAEAASSVVEGSEIKLPIGESAGANVTFTATVIALD
jgi:type II secretory pathway pseudopilin PulG